jgi:hypothetical protein
MRFSSLQRSQHEECDSRNLLLRDRDWTDVRRCRANHSPEGGFSPSSQTPRLSRHCPTADGSVVVWMALLVRPTARREMVHDDLLDGSRPVSSCSRFPVAGFHPRGRSAFVVFRDLDDLTFLVPPGVFQPVTLMGFGVPAGIPAESRRIGQPRLPAPGVPP